MKKPLTLSMLLLLSVCLFIQANAQNKQAKTKSKTTEKTKQEEPPPPPPKELPPGITMDTATASDISKYTTAIDFDTSAVPEDELTAAIRKYFDITNSLEMASGLIKVMYESEDMKQILPEDFRTKFIKAYEKGGLGYLYMERINIRALRKQFTVKDMEDLVEFYKTPIGKKFSLATPLITKEAAVEGGKLGKWIASQLY